MALLASSSACLTKEAVVEGELKGNWIEKEAGFDGPKYNGLKNLQNETKKILQNRPIKNISLVHA